jgi:hypothetical protein
MLYISDNDVIKQHTTHTKWDWDVERRDSVTAYTQSLFQLDNIPTYIRI